MAVPGLSDGLYKAPPGPWFWLRFLAVVESRHTTTFVPYCTVLSLLPLSCLFLLPSFCFPVSSSSVRLPRAGSLVS